MFIIHAHILKKNVNFSNKFKYIFISIDWLNSVKQELTTPWTYRVQMQYISMFINDWSRCLTNGLALVNHIRLQTEELLLHKCINLCAFQSEQFSKIENAHMNMLIYFYSNTSQTMRNFWPFLTLCHY